MNRKKLRGKMIDKRLDHKKLRAATRQVLAGQHYRTIVGTKWSHRSDQPPLL